MTRDLDSVEAQLAMFDYHAEWDQLQLVYWLDRNIPDENIMPDEKTAFLDKAVSWLTANRGFAIDDLIYSKFRLRNALATKIKKAKTQAKQGIHQTMLIDAENFSSDSDCVTVFEQGRYAYDQPYRGFTDLPKHFFPEIGNLNVEEFDCAVFLATQLEGVKYWVRNVEKKPTSFSLQTGTDRFYPDFLCKLGSWHESVGRSKGSLSPMGRGSG